MLTLSRRHCFVSVAFALFGFGIGLMIGLFAPERFGSKSDILLKQLTREADPYIGKKMIEGIDAANISKHIRELSSEPRLGGTSGSYRSAEYVKRQWEEQGYDVQIVSFDVLLSYPEPHHINTVNLVESDGGMVFQTSPLENAYIHGENHPDVVQAYNAFSPSGEPQGDLVYANYARDVDFEKLLELGVNVTGKIVIAKYGKSFRGNKVDVAHQYGAIGIILYMDPSDYTEGDLTYPDTAWLPPTGVQRGNIVMKKGDQATPGYPAKWYTARLTSEEIEHRLPKIPSQPIGYSDAYMFLRDLEGIEAPTEWQGGLNITYRLGGTLAAGRKVKLNIKNELKYSKIYNVIARINGEIENDRVVLMGTHRDSWVFGGTDPNSGTASMLEISRVYAHEVKQGWKPRRTILFCSWDAEEFGLVGSYEWVEENVKWLQREAVAYLNMDSLTSGNYSFFVAATPTLKQAVYRAAKQVPDPDVEDKNMYEVWKSRDPGAHGLPRIAMPGAGTDFLPFEQEVALPTLDTDYKYIITDKKKYSGYPVYHTLYDGFHFTQMMDPGFLKCKAVSGFLVELIRDLIDSPLLPLDVRDYAAAVGDFVETLLGKEGERFASHNISTDGIKSASRNFTDSAMHFHNRYTNVDHQNPFAVRSINDRIMCLDKAFQVTEGLPDRKEYKHVLLSPSRANYYSTTTFPGMSDLLYQIEEDEARWEKVRKHMSVLTFTIQSAADILTL